MLIRFVQLKARKEFFAVGKNLLFGILLINRKYSLEAFHMVQFCFVSFGKIRIHTLNNLDKSVRQAIALKGN